MRLGLLGGTFDPVHYGHLRFAQESLELFSLDEVVFMPVGIPPHKETSKITPAEKRLKMVELAIQGNPRFCISDLEIRKPWMSYSVETIKEIKEEFAPGLELYFLVGCDVFEEIGTWKDYQELLSLCNFVVAARAGQASSLPLEIASAFCYHEMGCYRHLSGTLLHYVEITALDISSTRIREAVSQGKSIRYLLPGEVENFIKREDLYTNREG